VSSTCGPQSQYKQESVRAVCLTSRYAGIDPYCLAWTSAVRNRRGGSRCDLLVGLDGLYVVAGARDPAGGGLSVAVESVAPSRGAADDTGMLVGDQPDPPQARLGHRDRPSAGHDLEHDLGRGPGAARGDGRRRVPVRRRGPARRRRVCLAPRQRTPDRSGWAGRSA
jgi:hypothetical protein